MKSRVIVIAGAVLCIALCCISFKSNGAEAAKVVRLEDITVQIEPTPAPSPAPTPVTVSEESAKEYRYIQDCPLSKDVQQGIFDICERYNVAFELVMAVIQKESNYDAAAVGDNGDSVGLMQIQEKWHSGLMEKLGVTDLYDPLENVEVGVALLERYFKEGKEVYYALMKYNGGGAYANRMLKAGKVSDYALEIVETASEYTEQNE